MQPVRTAARTVAVRATAIATAILGTAALAGDRLLPDIGLGMSALQVAGGLLLLMTAWRMLGPSSRHRPLVGNDPAIVPVAFPLLAGPACITTVVLLTARTDGTMGHVSAVLAALVLVQGTALMCLLIAPRVADWLGPTGVRIACGLSGLLLAALAAQQLASGGQRLLLALVSRA